MDSALLLTVVYAFLALETYSRCGTRQTARALLFLVLPGALLVSAWLGWKLAYYGSILPNTYYAKMLPPAQTWFPGVRFLWVFLDSYWLPGICALAVGLLFRSREGWNRQLGMLAGLVLAGGVYAVRIGGDFMEFRVLVAILPGLFVLLAWILVRVCPWRWLTVSASVLVIVGSFDHARRFEFVHGIESVGILRGHLYDPKQSWVQVGHVLGELFDDPEAPVRIATTASGAIPYYSSLPTVDMLGLTDAWVARHGITGAPGEGSSPGHNRLAPFRYLADRRVNLVVGHPWVSERRSGPRPNFGWPLLSRMGLAEPDPGDIPEDARMKVLEIDLDPNHRLYVVYLTPHPAVERAIVDHDLRTHSITLPRRSG
jgi:arabinofuranosyltransferase